MSRIPLKAVLRELNRRNISFENSDETKRQLRTLGNEVGKYGASVLKMKKEYRNLLARCLKATRGTKYENYALRHIKTIDRKVEEFVGEILGLSQMCYNIAQEGISTIDKF